MKELLERLRDRVYQIEYDRGLVDGVVQVHLNPTTLYELYRYLMTERYRFNDGGLKMTDRQTFEFLTYGVTFKAIFNPFVKEGEDKILIENDCQIFERDVPYGKFVFQETRPISGIGKISESITLNTVSSNSLFSYASFIAPNKQDVLRGIASDYLNKSEESFKRLASIEVAPIVVSTSGHSLQFFIKPEDTYQVIFMDGVDDTSLNKAVIHANKQVKAKIERICQEY